MTALLWKPSTYIYPPRPEHSIPYEEINQFANDQHLAQLKYNDTRIVIKVADYYDERQNTHGKIEIWNRHKKKLNYVPTESTTAAILKLASIISPNGWCLLDGGLLHSKHKAIKDTIVIWDILVQNSEYLLGTTYQERYNTILTDDVKLHYFQVGGYKICLGWCYGAAGEILIPHLIPHAIWEIAWANIVELNSNYDQPLIEGFVIKEMAGKLEMGLKPSNNGGWQTRCRVKTKSYRF